MWKRATNGRYVASLGQSAGLADVFGQVYGHTDLQLFLVTIAPGTGSWRCCRMDLKSFSFLGIHFAVLSPIFHLVVLGHSS